MDAVYLFRHSPNQDFEIRPVPQETWTYIEHVDYNGVTVYNIASDTVYRNDDGTGAETTSYSYTYLSNAGNLTNQIGTEAETLPTVLTTQNGSGTASVITAVFNLQNQLVWSKDANGVIITTLHMTLQQAP